MTDTKFIDDWVKAINKYRERHQVAPLTQNKDLSAIAQKWADHLAAINSLRHNPDQKYKGESLGENCASNWSSDGQPKTGQERIDEREDGFFLPI